VQVDDDVEIGANTTVDRARFGRTWIGEGTKIDNLVQIGHNVVIGKHCLIVSQAGHLRSSKLGNYVTIAGPGRGLSGHIELGDGRDHRRPKRASRKDVPPSRWSSVHPLFPCAMLNSSLRTLVDCPVLRERVKRLEQALGETEKSSSASERTLVTRQGNLYVGRSPESRIPMAHRKRKLAAAKLPLQRQFAFQEKGEFFDLRKIFDKLNAQYFRNRLKGYAIVWGQKRKQRPREYMVFGTIQEEDRIIRIHPLLDRALVPSWFLEYVVYHEMCHAVVPDLFDESGRPHRASRKILRKGAPVPVVPTCQAVGRTKTSPTSSAEGFAIDLEG
jgi:hypothetical protein